MNESNEVVDTLKAIHAEQVKQGKHLRNIYQIMMIAFTLALIGFCVSFLAGAKLANVPR